MRQIAGCFRLERLCEGWIVWTLLLLVHGSVYAAGSIQPLNTRVGSQNIKTVAWLLPDQEGHLLPAQAWTGPFVPYQASLIDSDHAVYWLKFSLYNPTDRPATMYTSGFFSDRIEVFLYDPQTDSLKDLHVQSGYLVPVAERTVNYSQSSMVSFVVPPHSTQTYLLRIHNYTAVGRWRAGVSFTMGFILYNQATYKRRYGFLNNYNLFLAGLMLATMLYNILLAVRLREPVFAYLTLYNLANFSWVFLLGGMLISMCGVTHLAVERVLRLIIPFGTVPWCYALFCMKFLRVRDYAPRLRYVIWGLIVAFTVGGAFYLLDVGFAFTLQFCLTTTIYVLLFVCSVLTYRQKHPYAGYLVVGTALYFSAAAVFMVHVKIESLNYLNGHVVMQTVILIEIILFSVATTKQMACIKTRAQEEAAAKEAMAQALKQERQHREAESRKLVAYTMERIRQNEMIASLRQQLQQVEANAAQTARIHKGLEALHAPEAGWDTFKQYFENVHPQFFDTLHRQWPALTPNEERLCAFLKMRLTTKEIATLQGVTSRAIDKARERLKKKMMLEDGVNVSDVIRAVT